MLFVIAVLTPYYNLLSDIEIPSISKLGFKLMGPHFTTGIFSCNEELGWIVHSSVPTSHGLKQLFFKENAEKITKGN